MSVDRQEIKGARQGIATQTQRFTDRLNEARGVAFDGSITTEGLRPILAELGTTPSDLSSAHRAKTLEPFRGFFFEVQERLANLTQSRRARRAAVKVDRELTTPNDPIDKALRAIFSDKNLRREWMGKIDQRVSMASETNLAEIDERKAEKGELVEKELVIVGGGPVTALLAAQLGPYYKITVITEQDAIGKPWRSRPNFLNSSAEDDFLSGRTPLQKGSTTPLTPFGTVTNITPADLLVLDAAEDVLTVSCSDKKKRRYISGRSFGEIIATNIAANVTDFIVGQRVETEDSFGPGLDTILTLTDADGVKRRIRADAVIYATGPGKEKLGTNDPESNELFKEGVESLKEQLKVARELLSYLRNYVAATGGKPEDFQRLLLESKQQFMLKLPRVLNYTMVEMITDYWITDLGESEEIYPLEPLFDESNSLGFGGDGDNARVMIELFRGLGPANSRPKRLQAKSGGPRVTIYNEEAGSQREYDARARNRYTGRVFIEGTTSSVPRKASRISQVTENGQEKIRVRDISGFSSDYDYYFPAAGLSEPDTLRNLQRAGVSMVYTPSFSTGTIVSRANGDRNTFIVGTASQIGNNGFFPNEIRQIINRLQINENTVALWAYIYLTEIFGWDFLSKKGINKDFVAQTVAYGRAQRMVAPQNERRRFLSSIVSALRR
ncbi:MAG TPA: hypothetical protein VFQ63_02410 [Patescibacteria group bacterium]|nr:hypothetical protein [Patescibacteria group bacterium]